MRLCHVVRVTPHGCGLYETVRDLVVKEATLGHDVFIVDPERDLAAWDRGATIELRSRARTADILINHSGLGAALRDVGVPRIFIQHATPYHKFLREQIEKAQDYTYLEFLTKDDRYKAFVTFWPEHMAYWELLVPKEKLHAVNAPVDLGCWRLPGGNDAGYDFGGKRGEINIIYASPWRVGYDGFHILHAFHLFAQQVKGAKLHIYASPIVQRAMRVLYDALSDKGILGEVCVEHKNDMRPIYYAADAVLVQCGEASRVVRESLACGAQVVMRPGNTFTPYLAEPHNISCYADAMRCAWIDQYDNKLDSMVQNRRSAERHFDSANTAKGIIAVCEKVLEEKNA